MEDRYRPYLENHLTQLGMDTKDIILNLGKQAGNLMNVPLSTIAQSKVDLLVTGPPCPPWSSCGKKQGLQYPKAKEFIRIFQWALVMIKCCGLMGLVIENVVGITYETNGREPVVSRFMELMKNLCPEFSFVVDIAKAVDYQCPQTRVRVFIRGVRKCISEQVPAMLPPFGTRSIRSLLGKFPSDRRADLTPPQQHNLKQIEMRLQYSTAKS